MLRFVNAKQKRGRKIRRLWFLKVGLKRKLNRRQRKRKGKRYKRRNVETVTITKKKDEIKRREIEPIFVR